MKEGKRFIKGTIRLLPLALAVCLAGCGSRAKETEVKAGKEGTRIEEDSGEENSALNVFGGEEAQLQDRETQNEETLTDAENGVEDEKASEAGDDGLTNEGDTVESAQASEAETGTVPPAQVRERPDGWTLTLASEDWGLSFGESGTAPTGNASAEDLAWYDAYYVGDNSEKVIYLTFDCGYENGNTEPILDALKKHNAPATFFVVGHFLETASDMAKRMVEDGHTVGNHTYHHLDMPTISDMETFQKEMDDVANLFYEITGTELSPFYRPPQGKCNTKNLEMAQELGYYTIFWSLAHVDWMADSQPSHEEALDKLTKRIHPGAIVLLHNTSQTNGEILDELLTKWEEMGYSFKTLSELVRAGG